VLAAVLIGVALLAVVTVVAVVLLRPTPKLAPPRAHPLAISCPDVAPVMVGKLRVPAGPIGGYCQPQLINAAQIMNAGRQYALPIRSQEIGVMTAIGESGLRNLTFGDKVGPDSRGLFQQRSNWGPLAERMNPYIAAQKFFRRMLGVPGWQTRPPTEVAHAVQANANPNYYTTFWPRAQEIVVALAADEVVIHRRGAV
jgi:hypothetical protein